jgi:sporulation protein YlmC with PRC-barrel domain
MNSNLKTILFLLLAACLPVLTRAERDADPERMGAEKTLVPISQIQVVTKNHEHLGSIKDVAIDLDNGRIVEVLVRSGGFLGIGSRVVAVPPEALSPNGINKEYVLDATKAKFHDAPEINLSDWNLTDRSDRVAAAYRYFGADPYFLGSHEKANPADARPKVPLGYIARANKIVGMKVVNRGGQPIGTVADLGFNLLTGRVLNVIIASGGELNKRSIVPSMALRFDTVHRGLVLNDTAAEFAAEPRQDYAPAANGHPSYTTEESYEGPHTQKPLVQGKTYRDRDRTKQIYADIGDAKIDRKNIEVGTVNGRVTLRGWVKTEEDRVAVEVIAVSDSRVELVDNQLMVGKPAAK